MITLYCIRPKGFNIGNDVIFLGLQHFISKAFGPAVNLITLPATSCYENQTKAGLTAKVIYEINQYGHGVIVGGGNLYENGELDVNLDALEALEVPLMLFSLSRGCVYNRRHELVERTDVLPDRVVLALNNKAQYSLARDHATGSYLRSIGCRYITVSGCPTIFLERLPLRDQRGVLISVRNPALMSIPSLKQSQVPRDIREIIDFLRLEGFQDIHLLCNDHRDVSFAASFEGVGYVYTEDVHDYLALLRSCALVVSYRLHAALPCLAFGTPTIKISYDERALSLMETVGFEEWNINMITDDVVTQVIDRYRRLDSLALLRAQAQERWNHLYAVTSDAFRNFASDVMEWR